MKTIFSLWKPWKAKTTYVEICLETSTKASKTATGDDEGESQAFGGRQTDFPAAGRRSSINM